MIRVRADFNGLFGDLLCLSHGGTCRDEAGHDVSLVAGMTVTAFEPDVEDGQRVYLVATGLVEPSSASLRCNGSRWALRIDERGVRHVSEEEIEYHRYVIGKVRSSLERADTEGAIEQDEAEARLAKWNIEVD
jgi:hypothetical protein